MTRRGGSAKNQSTAAPARSASRLSTDHIAAAERQNRSRQQTRFSVCVSPVNVIYVDRYVGIIRGPIACSGAICPVITDCKPRSASRAGGQFDSLGPASSIEVAAEAQSWPVTEPQAWCAISPWYETPRVAVFSSRGGAVRFGVLRFPQISRCVSLHNSTTEIETHRTGGDYEGGGAEVDVVASDGATAGVCGAGSFLLGRLSSSSVTPSSFVMPTTGGSPFLTNSYWPGQESACGPTAEQNS